MNTDIAVIVVNYGTADLAMAAVQSVLDRHHGGRSVEVHLVDNASPSGDAARFAKAHVARGWGERVTLWPETENHGFGRGNNVVLEALSKRAIPPRYVFLLNPDAELDNEALDLLASYMDGHHKVAIAGVSICRETGRQVTAAFRFPSLRTEVLQALGIGRISRLFSQAEVALPSDTSQGPVDWVTGAGFMARFSALSDVGFFDPDFFLYYEETELMWRLRQAGYEVIYYPEARIEHAAGAATGQGSEKQGRKPAPVYLYDSWRLFFVKSRGVGYARRIALARWSTACLSAILRSAFRRSPHLPKNFLCDFRRHVLLPLFTGDPMMARPDGKTIVHTKGAGR
jgi:GT2 family glycosyltransferase